MVKNTLKALLALGAVLAGAAAFLLPVRLAEEKTTDLFGDPRRVEIAGYDGDAMEPFLSPDGRWLFFNNSNEKPVDTNLHFAERTGVLSFRYRGELPGANSTELDAVPCMDASGRFYFTSGREYIHTLKTTFVGRFDGKQLADVRPVSGGIYPKHLGAVNMDVGVSLDGSAMYISRARFVPLVPLPPFWSQLLVARKAEDGSFVIDPRSEELMKNVNTRALAYAPAISPDGLELYFTRTSFPAGMRLMVATREKPDEAFDEPRVLADLPTGGVEAPTLSSNLSELFFHKKTAGKWAIFRATRRKRYNRDLKSEQNALPSEGFR
ncbi:MAG: PD40 domain-containing protein [Elusimicrobia bacterium]|nr:PD40 domain-containing protein [Elusimicrobiota bacterium]